MVSYSFYIELNKFHHSAIEIQKQFQKICKKNIIKTFNAINNTHIISEMSILSYQEIPDDPYYDKEFYSNHNFLEVKISGNDNEVDEDLLSHIYDEFCLFIIACNIAIPGSIDIDKRVSFYIDNEKFSWGHIFTNELREFMIGEQKYFQNNIKNLDILETWEWAKQFHGFNDSGLSSNKISRSLCAFINFFSLSWQYYYPSYFIWSMIGIEALYADGTQSVQHQIRQKAKTLFKLEDFELKKINKVYDFRSRFFHGQINMYNSFLIGSEYFDYKKSVKTLSDKEHDYMEYSVRLFIATLQHCAENCLKDLEFEYILKNK